MNAFLALIELWLRDPTSIRLTCADVHNVAFPEQPSGNRYRGYNESEVDATLDLVEDEMARMFGFTESPSRSVAKKPPDHQSQPKSVAKSVVDFFTPGRKSWY